MAQARCAHRPSVVGFIAPPIEFSSDTEATNATHKRLRESYRN